MSNVNVVTVTYNDLHKLNWLHLVSEKNYDFTLYAKDNNLKIGEVEKRQVETSNYYIEETVIPNYGKCEYAFLYHIINNYNDLADYTVFTKIHWYDQGINFYDLINNCANYDYYEVGMGLHSYVWYNNDNLHLKEVQGDTYINVDTPYVTGNPFNFDGRAKRWEVFEDWYNHIFPDRNNVPGKIYAFDHGPCFSVSKELIRRHPISVYEYLLERFHPSSNAWDFILDNDERKTLDNVAQHYHDNLVRFHRLLFTHGVNQDNFKIQQYF
jgi:hypothetical protein